MATCAVLGSIVVSISACHAEDPGSIPGRGGLIFFSSSFISDKDYFYGVMIVMFVLLNLLQPNIDTYYFLPYFNMQCKS